MKTPKHLDGRGKGEMSYDYKYDIMLFKIKNRNYNHSIEYQNIVIDIDDKGFISGIQVFDASKVFKVEKFNLKNISQWELNASIESKVLNITLKFVSKVRNSFLPIFTHNEHFNQQFVQQGISMANTPNTSIMSA